MSPTSPPKQTSVSAAWAAWVADGSSSAGSHFLQRISSWIEGTSAQLLRARWPDTERPTSAELEERLATEKLDLTLPAPDTPKGSVHPVSQDLVIGIQRGLEKHRWMWASQR